ncbi:DNA-directed RNA polymerase III subunit RPC4 [Vespula maculifrons]|uniref:DNA-directed RNA polymerase III subunit RPC4 n=1 Tax=Vespula maculifrons TaxID=7453 RepID=A0ABD2BVI8_VESMC
MASDKLRDKNHTLPENVRIKIEPGTSLPVPLRNIKTEPGVSPTTTRLTSFRLPRDLTLGGNIKTEKPKKVYVPNFNAQRNKKKEETVVNKNDTEKPSKQRGRGRGRGLSDRGRGRVSNNLIQTSGVFSQGATDTQGGRRSKGQGGDRYSDSDRKVFIDKPKLNLDRDIDKDEEERKLKALLKDDFIDDGTEPDTENAPVILPMILEGKLYKTESKHENSISDDEEIDQKPIILENGTVMKPKKEMKKEALIKNESKKPNQLGNISQVIENKPHSYMLMQFPDCLPGLESNDDANPPKPKHANDMAQEKDSKENTKKNYCTLSSLKAGMLGKLQILKSGKARLCIGENNLIVDIGSNLSFRQDLLAAKLDTVKLNGELINLGTINNTLVCSPDWESMLLKM